MFCRPWSGCSSSITVHARDGVQLANKARKKEWIDSVFSPFLFFACFVHILYFNENIPYNYCFTVLGLKKNKARKLPELASSPRDNDVTYGLVNPETSSACMIVAASRMCGERVSCVLSVCR